MSRGQFGAIAGSRRSNEWVFSDDSSSYSEHLTVFEPGTENFYSFYSYNKMLTKMTKDGRVLWQKQINADVERTFSISRISDGSLFLAGYLDTLFDVSIIVKLDANGNVIWSKQYAVGYEAVSYARFASDSSGSNAYLALTRKINNGDPNGAPQIATLLKINTSTGAVIWSRQLSGPAGLRTFFRNIAVGSDGSAYGIGVDMLNADFEFDGFVVKYNTSGTLLWQRKFNRTNSGQYTQYMFLDGIRLDSSDNVYLSGSYRYSGAPVYGNVMYYAKLNSSGTLQHQYGIHPNPLPSGNFPTYITYCELGGSGTTTYLLGYGYFDAATTTDYYGHIVRIDDGVVNFSTGITVIAPTFRFGSVTGFLVDSSHMYFNSYVFSGGANNGLFKLPIDGSKTGKYAVKNVTAWYRNFPAQRVTPPMTISTGSLSAANLSETLTVSDLTYSATTNLSIPTYLRRI